MSSQHNNGLPHSFGNSFHLSSEDDFPLSNQGENVLSSSGNGATGLHPSSNLILKIKHNKFMNN